MIVDSAAICSSAAANNSTTLSPVDITEILLNILHFLDQRSLLECSRVSSLWRSCSLPILWRTFAIPSRRLASYFKDPQELLSEPSLALSASTLRPPSGDLVEFTKNCHRITSLSIGDDSPEHLDYGSKPHYWSQEFASTYHFLQQISERQAQYFQHPGLANLVYLDMRYIGGSPKYSGAQDAFYDVMFRLISNNRQLRQLQFTDVGDASMRPLFTRLQINSIPPLIQSLSVKSDIWHEFGDIFQVLATERDLTTSLDYVDQGREGKSVGLDELFLQNLSLRHSRDIDSWRPGRISAFPGHLPIRSLSLLDFNIIRGETYIDEGSELQVSDPEDDVILEILRKCPLLERLRITYDLSAISKSTREPFSHRVLQLLSGVEEYDTWIPAQDDFVDLMLTACPRLKAIDLGGNISITSEQWEQMMSVYGPQLQSLRVWGVENFTSKALMQLLGPPFPSLMQGSPRGVFAGLTDLDISWVADMDSCIWTVFRHVPTLKHFKALEVPADATELTRCSWVCTELETLAIQVLVPRQYWPPEGTWIWDEEDDQWKYKETGLDEIDFQRQVANQGARASQNEAKDAFGKMVTRKKRRVEGNSKDVDELKKLKKDRGNKKRRKERKERCSKKEGSEAAGPRKVKKESISKKRECGRHRDPESDSDSSIDLGFCLEQAHRTDADVWTATTISGATPISAAPMSPQVPRSYSSQMQVKVCEQLGRLSKLRELTLEGRQDCRYLDREWDCLRLTLRTGLDRLKGLQNLERLVVYQLEEELAGRQEVEWIARHWAHYRNPAWLESHHCLDGRVPKSQFKDHWKPKASFKELIGISVRSPFSYSSALEANMNVAWLQEQCPNLTVEKDDRRQYDDFSYGRFEDY
ncbi:hypothetical protein BGX28_001298 [Mortierella sp. GBA30]|nr:hypothetical protein BGX28_001298 [Mortierella sp. GBA30]